VALLVDERKDAGSYDIPFDGTGLSSGIYICRLTSGAHVQSRRLILLK
jgi:hypothetical protein